MTKVWMSAVLAAALTVAPAVAQRGPGMGRPGGPGAPMMGGDPAQRLSQLATLLDLTEAQKAAAEAIFNSAKTQSEPLVTAMKEAHEAVQTAVKDNRADGDIDTLTARVGALTGQLGAINAKSQRSFRQVLTQQQREKLDAVRSGIANRFARP